MVPDSELIEKLRHFLATSDLTTTTTAILRRRLEEHFAIDLSGRKAFIREQVDEYMQSQIEKGSDNEEVEEGKEIQDEGVVEEEEEEEAEDEEEESAKSSAKKRLVSQICDF